MTQYRELISLTLLFAVLSSPDCWSTTYYVSSSSGHDDDAGSVERPWRTILRVNRSSLFPGDQVLFKRGDIWREQLKPAFSGSEGSPIVFGAYGSGAMPSIRGSDIVGSASRWIREGEKLWFLPMSTDPVVLSHDGNLGQRMENKEDLSSQWDYWFDKERSRLYVVSADAPPSMAAELEGGVRQYAVGPQSSSFITFDNLDIRHGTKAGWLGWGATNVTFRSCSFTQSGGDHLLFHKGSNGGKVYKCSFSDWGISSGQFYAVHTQGTASRGTGPLDIKDSLFTALFLDTPGGMIQPAAREHTAIMQDENSWIRTVEHNVIDGSGRVKDDGIVIWSSSGASTSHLIEANVIKNIGGMAIAIQHPEKHGGHPQVTLRDNRIENVSMTHTPDKAAIRIRDVSSASSVAVLSNKVNQSRQMQTDSPGIDISAASGVKLNGNTISGADNGIMIRNNSKEIKLTNNSIYGNHSFGIKVDASSSAISDYNDISGNCLGNYDGVPPGAHDVTTSSRRP